MDLAQARASLLALDQPAALIEGRYGPLTEEQSTYAQMIYTGSLKARQWLEDWCQLEGQARSSEALAIHVHKINSGLTMMIGYASLMLSEFGGALSAELEAALSAIVSTGEQVHLALQQNFEERLRNQSA